MVFNRPLSLSLAFASLLALSACAAQSYPKGYRYQDDTPLSSPQPSSPWDDKAVIHDTEKMATNTAAWQGAVYELVDKLEPHLPKDGTPLNITAENGLLKGDTSNNALDHYLRQTLIQRGYNLTTISNAGLILSHKVKKAKLPKTYDISVSVLDAKGRPVATETVPAVLPE